jgi:hypothetical protein
VLAELRARRQGSGMHGVLGGDGNGGDEDRQMKRVHYPLLLFFSGAELGSRCPGLASSWALFLL